MRRTTLWSLGLLLATLPLGRTGAQAANDESTVPRMGLEEFKKGLAAGTLVAIDVRAREAYVAGHIPGARLVPLGEVATHADRLRALKKPIVAYCA